MEQTDFSWALRKLKAGYRISREGWNRKGMWLALQTPDENSKMKKPYIYIHPCADSVRPWVASQADLLEDDCTVLAEPQS